MVLRIFSFSSYLEGFIHFILNNLPRGLIGLLLAVILSAAMSSTASELNALAATTTMDLYKRNETSVEI